MSHFDGPLEHLFATLPFDAAVQKKSDAHRLCEDLHENVFGHLSNEHANWLVCCDLQNKPNGCFYLRKPKCAHAI